MVILEESKAGLIESALIEAESAADSLGDTISSLTESVRGAGVIHIRFDPETILSLDADTLGGALQASVRVRQQFADLRRALQMAADDLSRLESQVFPVEIPY